MYELQHMLAKTIIRISSPGPPSVSEERAQTHSGADKKITSLSAAELYNC